MVTYYATFIPGLATEALQSQSLVPVEGGDAVLHAFLPRPRSLRWFSTGTSPGPGIRAAAHMSSSSTWSSSQGSSSQRSSYRWSSSQGSSSQGSSCRGSSSCRSHRHHRRRNYTSLASGDPLWSRPAKAQPGGCQGLVLIVLRASSSEGS